MLSVTIFYFLEALIISLDQILINWMPAKSCLEIEKVSFKTSLKAIMDDTFLNKKVTTHF